MKNKPLKIAAIVAAALFFVALVVLTIAVVFFPATSEPASDPTPDTPSDTAAGTDGETKAEDKGEFAVSGDEAELHLPKIKFNDSGVAQMQVTTDPRVAAASAAQVLWSVDTTRTGRFSEDYVVDAFEMIAHPSPDYVGPGDTITYETRFSETPVTTDEYWGFAPRAAAESSHDPSGWWFQLGDQYQFEQFHARDAVVESVPITVFDSAQVDAFSGGAWWAKADVEGLTVNLKPGAVLEEYWVRVETTVTTGTGVQALSRNPAAMMIYCDPPADGGICGVQLLTTKYPDSWQLH